MIYNLVLNSTNLIDSINKTQYAYTFINGNFYIPENSKMCISQCMIPYSWFNINSTLYNNNSFSYVWYYGNGLSKITFGGVYFLIIAVVPAEMLVFIVFPTPIVTEVVPIPVI